MNKKVVLDSSALLGIEEFKIDIFQRIKEELEGKIEFYITTSVMREIENLSKNRGKRGVKAKTALLVIKKYEEEIEVVPYEGNADSSVLRFAKDYDAYIATADRKIKDLALKNGLEVIVIRGKKVEVI